MIFIAKLLRKRSESKARRTARNARARAKEKAPSLWPLAAGFAVAAAAAGFLAGRARKGGSPSEQPGTSASAPAEAESTMAGKAETKGLVPDEAPDVEARSGASPNGSAEKAGSNA